MSKYNVYGILGASVFIGEYEADTKEAADKMAEEDPEANWNPSLCFQCGREVDIGDVYETQVEEIG